MGQRYNQQIQFILSTELLAKWPHKIADQFMNNIIMPTFNPRGKVKGKDYEFTAQQLCKQVKRFKRKYKIHKVKEFLGRIFFR